MVTEADLWNDPDDLQNRSSLLNNSLGRNTLLDILKSAHREATTRVGPSIEEELQPTHQDQQVFQLAFAEIRDDVGTNGLLALEVDDEDHLNSSNWNSITHFKEGGAEINFTDDFFNSELGSEMFRLVVEYIPQDFADLELAIALDEAWRIVAIETGDSEAETRSQKWEKKMDNIEKSINRRAANLSDPERGERVPANMGRSDWT